MSAATVTAAYTLTYTADVEGITAARPAHTHQSTPSTGETITYSEDAGDSSNTDGKPPSKRAIIIEPDDSSQLLPDDVIVFANATSAPSGWHVTDGLGDSIDLNDLFVIGAEAAGDGGAAIGAAAHGHTGVHTHATTDHSHADIICGNPLIGVTIQAGVEDYVIPKHHWVGLGSTSAGSTNSGTAVIADATWAPAYRYLLGVQNTSGVGVIPPIGTVLPFFGTLAGIASNWQLCDGTNGTYDLTTRQVRVTVTGGTVGTTGGVNSHTHTVSAAHGHTMAGSHTHTEITWIANPLAAGDRDTAIAVISYIKPSHTHTWTIGSTTPTLSNNAGFTTGSADGRYSYRECVFIQKMTAAAARRVMMVT